MLLLQPRCEVFDSFGLDCYHTETNDDLGFSIMALPNTPDYVCPVRLVSEREAGQSHIGLSGTRHSREGGNPAPPIQQFRQLVGPSARYGLQ